MSKMDAPWGEASLTHHNRITSTKHHARYALLTQYFMMGFVYASLVSRYPAINAHYGMSIRELSYIPLSMAIGSLIITPMCCHLSARFGSKKLTALSYAYMLLLPLMTLMPHKLLVFPFCALYGMLVTITDVAINGNSILVENAYKRPVVSMFHALYYVGVCCGALLSILFITYGFPVYVHHLSVALFSVAIIFYIRRFFLQETITRTEQVEKRPFLILPKGILLLIAFIALCSRVTEGSFTNWSTVYMKTIVSLPENLAPLGLTIYAAFMSIGRSFGDRLRQRYSDPTILFWSCLLTSFGILTIISNPHFICAAVGFFIAGLGISCLVPIIYSLAGKQKGVNPGMGIAMVNTVSSTAFLFGPFLIGAIADATSMRVAYGYVFGLTLIMTFLTYRLMNHK